MERSMEHELVSELNFDASPVPCYVCGAQFGLGPMSQDMRYPPDHIFIPQELRGQMIADFPIPVRLHTSLRTKAYGCSDSYTAYLFPR